MRILKWILGLLLALVLVVLVGGMMISPRYQVSRSVEINAPVDKIYALVASPKAWNTWSVWNLRDPTMQIDYSGPESGTGATWAWKSKAEGSGKVIITTAEPGQRVAFDLLMEGFDRPSKGELVFAPAGAGTKVSWSMNGDMGNNPMFRWFALFADRMMGKDFEGGLANLKAKAETK
jgi:uncharacterized protein YndB with AHSA1/START domain